MRRLVPALATCLLLSGCASTVSLTPAPDATAVGCARVIVGIRDVDAIGAAERRNTDAQGTAAWGTPASVTLYCGVETPVASTVRCYPYRGIDWLSTDSGRDRVLTTFGREPGVQIITTPGVSINDALDELADPIAGATRATGRTCLGATDAPAPSPSS